MTETAAAEAAPQVVPAAQTKAPKKKKAPARKKAAGPKLSDQIDNIVADCHDRRGMSFYAIKKGLAAKGVDVEKCRHLIKTGIKRKLVNGSLVQIKGVGASGSFKTEQEINVQENPDQEITGKKINHQKIIGEEISLQESCGQETSA
ncbi:histone H1.2-like [Amblyraja radiata]|uniref:histone H1.2-like n=1 Tax=Amblyraja radiata TaxID=386614 RepID=UPI001401D3F0|nr:histone H1.2-like [Amblyraja radiata]